MRTKAGIISLVLFLILLAGCAMMDNKSPEALAKDYAAKAQQFEKQGDLVEALKQYKLALTVEPGNQPAQQKIAALEPRLLKLADQHYKDGLEFYNKGQYGQARREFLTALRYNPEHTKAKKKLEGTSKDLGQVKRYIVHTIQPDESISTLAEQYYGDYRKFHLIADYNEMADPTQVKVGQDIKIPVIEGMPIMADTGKIQAEAGASSGESSGEIIAVKRYITHTVQPEESLSKLAMLYYGDYTKFRVIAQFNHLDEGTSVRVGQELKIPEIDGVPFQVDTDTAEAETVTTARVAPVPEKADQISNEAENNTKRISAENQLAHHRELGIELYENKEYVAAIAKFETIASNNPDDKHVRKYLEKAHFQQGLHLFDKEDYLAARDEFKSALKYNPDCGQCRRNIQKSEDIYKEVHFEKGLTYFGDQKLAEAIREWESVSAMDPDYKDVSKNLTKAKTLYERLESIKRSTTQESTQ